MTPVVFSYKYVKRGGDGYYLARGNSLSRQSKKRSNPWVF